MSAFNLQVQTYEAVIENIFLGSERKCFFGGVSSEKYQIIEKFPWLKILFGFALL